MSGGREGRRGEGVHSETHRQGRETPFRGGIAQRSVPEHNSRVRQRLHSGRSTQCFHVSTVSEIESRQTRSPERRNRGYPNHHKIRGLERRRRRDRKYRGYRGRGKRRRGNGETTAGEVDHAARNPLDFRTSKRNSLDFDDSRGARVRGESESAASREYSSGPVAAGSVGGGSFIDAVESRNARGDFAQAK